MDIDRVEQMLRELGRRRPPERLFSGETARAVKQRLSPAGAEERSRAGEGNAAHAPLADRQSRRYVRGLVVSAAAATILLLAIPYAGRVEPVDAVQLAADGAYDRTDLFQTARGDHAKHGDRYYIGVRVDRSAYVRILALNADGTLESLPLDRSGATQREISPDSAVVFGGYELTVPREDQGETQTDAFLVLSSMEPLPDTGVAGWVDAQNQAAGVESHASVDRLRAELRRRFSCTVQTVRP